MKIEIGIEIKISEQTLGFIAKMLKGLNEMAPSEVSILVPTLLEKVVNSEKPKPSKSVGAPLPKEVTLPVDNPPTKVTTVTVTNEVALPPVKAIFVSPDTPKVELKELGMIMIKLDEAGKRKNLHDLLKAFSVDKLSSLPPARYYEFRDELQKIVI